MATSAHYIDTPEGQAWLKAMETRHGVGSVKIQPDSAVDAAGLPMWVLKQRGYDMGFKPVQSTPASKISTTWIIGAIGVVGAFVWLRK